MPQAWTLSAQAICRLFDSLAIREAQRVHGKTTIRAGKVHDGAQRESTSSLWIITVVLALGAQKRSRLALPSRICLWLPDLLAPDDLHPRAISPSLLLKSRASGAPRPGDFSHARDRLAMGPSPRGRGSHRVLVDRGPGPVRVSSCTCPSVNPRVRGEPSRRA